MIVTSSNKIISGNNRLIINDTINEFLGTINSNWSNAANWSLGVLPTSSHIAIIKVNCVLNIATICRRLYIDKQVTLYFTDNASIKMNELSNYGEINCAQTNNYLLVAKKENVYGNISFGDKGTLILNFTDPNNNVYIPNLDYYNLHIGSGISGGGVNGSLAIAENLTEGITNFIIENITLIRGNLLINRKVELKNSLEVKGALHIQYLNTANAGTANVGRLHILNSGLTLKIGGLFYKNLYSCIKFDGNPEVELKGGVSGLGNGYTYEHNAGTGIYRFNTNEQAIVSNSAQNSINLLNNVIIDDIKLTVSRISPSVGAQFTDINGTTTNSMLENLHYVRFNSILASQIMQTGKFITNDSNCIVEYALNGNQEIKIPEYAAYNELRLLGSGVKKLIGNAVCTHLYFAGAATLDLNGYTLTGYSKFSDLGTANRNLPSGSLDAVLITGSGTKLFTGNISCNSFIYNYGIPINRNGFELNAQSLQVNINMAAGNHQLLPYDYDSLTFSYLGGNGGSNRVLLTRNTLVNKMYCRGFKDHTNVFQVNESIYAISCDNWFFDGVEAQWVWPRTYVNLSLSSTGAKHLLADVIVTGSYYRAPSTVLNKNGFSIKDANGNILE